MALPVRVTYQGSAANAAYIYLTDDDTGSATQHLVDVPGSKGTIILDFDVQGRLIGIEVLNARKALPEKLLRAAERL